MRGLGFLLVAAVLSASGMAEAQRAARQPANAARAKPPTSRPATTPAPRPVVSFAKTKTTKGDVTSASAKPAQSGAKNGAKSDVPAAKAKAPTRNAKASKARTAGDAKADIGIPANALLVQYQRVGRELLLVSRERGAKIGVETEDAKLSCAELQATFRSIKLTDAVATPESRAETAAVLAELHAKIVRLRGVALTQACLDNPLAKDCT